MKKLRLMSVVGARPNFMKIAPFIEALHNTADADTEHFLVHTGQHYDRNMSESFFEVLGIPHPDADLGVGSGSHAEQVGKTMMAFEPVLREWRPDWVVVVGDVNATCACALTARKEGVRVAHIEAGLRSFDDSMPEEINRIVTDRLSHLLFTTDELADANLLREGVDARSIRRVGNIMIDTLEKNRDRAQALNVQHIAGEHHVDEHASRDVSRLGGGFALMTLHRPSNVDRRETLEPLVNLFCERLSPRLPLVWSLHPRTRERLQRYGLWERVVESENILLLDPLSYIEMLKLNMEARILLTDSGGMQEECCVVGTPCITLRENTERPVTLEEHGGVSVLAGNNPEKIERFFGDMLDRGKRTFRPPLWDGRTSLRIAEVFADLARDGTAAAG